MCAFCECKIFRSTAGLIGGRKPVVPDVFVKCAAVGSGKVIGLYVHADF